MHPADMPWNALLTKEESNKETNLISNIKM